MIEFEFPWFANALEELTTIRVAVWILVFLSLLNVFLLFCAILKQNQK